MGTPARPRRRDAGRPRGRHVTDAVLDATLAELAAAGLEGLSVERVALRADVHKTTVYRRWPTRAALVAAALQGIAADVVGGAPPPPPRRGGQIGPRGRRAAGRAPPHTTPVPRRAPPPAGRGGPPPPGSAAPGVGRAPDTGTLRGDLIGLLERLASFLDRPEGRAVARAALSSQAEAEVANLATRRLELPMAGAMVALVARARARGEWRHDLRAELVIPALVGALLHRALLEHADVGRPWLDDLVDLALAGITPRDAA